ncbi:MAG: radical SAM protein [Methanothrix sp.]|nr:radical SAM protein [Methanothrix sp.]
MTIVLINLPRYKSIPVIREGRCEDISPSALHPPATLLIIGALLSELDEVILIEANALNLNYRELSEQMQNIKRLDYIIFPFNALIMDYDIEISTIVKRINPLCVTIGYSFFARLFGKEILNEYRNLDIFITGPVLAVIFPLMTCFLSGKDVRDVGGIAYRDHNTISINNKDVPDINFNDLPLPAYDLLTSLKPYYIFNSFKPYALVYSGAGCPYKCTICNASRTKYSKRPLTDVIKELTILYEVANIKYVWFFDEIFTIDRVRTLELCKRITEENLGIKWFCDTRVELVDKNLLEVMQKAGCRGICYGVESGSQRILNSMNKGNTVEQARNALVLTRNAHIPIQLNLVLGFKGEDQKSLKETENLVKMALPQMLQIGIVTPHLGTEFARLAIENKWIDENQTLKECMMKGLKLKNYDPSNINLHDEIKKLNNILFYDYMWYVNNLHILLRNHDLISPIFKMLCQKTMRYLKHPQRLDHPQCHYFYGPGHGYVRSDVNREDEAKFEEAKKELM